MLFSNTTLAASISSIKQAQAKLGITADGIYGPQTKLAIITFQSKNGLTPDGILGLQTINALNKTQLPSSPSPDKGTGGVASVPDSTLI
ncbi:MAG: peptidoglycan-binding domain-containing protein, partial [Minisyncoccia bacterium]